MRVAALDREDLGAIRGIVEAAFPHDRVAAVLEEKLLGPNGSRAGTTLVAWDGESPAGVIAMAGRWIKLFAVDPGKRGHGVGTVLLDLARTWVRNRGGGGKLRFMDHPGNYLSPGLDLREVAGRSWVENHGFKVASENINLRVSLDGNPKVTEERAALLSERARKAGYEVRRVGRGERDLLLRVATEAFAAAWAFELGRAMEQDPPAVFAAFQGGMPVAFAAHDANNSGLGWFGPAGTLTAHRGHRLGEALLVHCLLDVRGRPEGGVIAWIGPREFYEKSAGAVEDRRFVVYEEGP
ncbi:MAG: GNAT family N-acetyltransferase [Myxococcales bacterium]|nr:GNAT family N-acetyltransferase [Myxococcales bacterium]